MTGAAGFIGSRLTAALSLRGDSILGIDSLDPRGPSVRARRATALRDLAQVEIRLVDIVRDDLHGALADADVVFHLAAEPGVRASWDSDFDRYALTNVVGTQRLLEAAKDVSPAARLVMASSSSIYGDQDAMPVVEAMTPAPRSPYGVTKLAAEHLAGAYRRDANLDVVCARMFTVCGPGQRPDMAIARLIASARDGATFVLSNPAWTRDYTHVDDAVSALMSLGGTRTMPQLSYNVSGGNRASIPEVAELVAAAVGTPPVIARGTNGRGDPEHTWADVSALTRDTAWRPAHSLVDAVRDQVADRDGVAGIAGPHNAEKLAAATRR